MFMILSNEYNGDNLTVESNLVPFDMFDGLVENKFDVRLRRYKFTEKSFTSIKPNANMSTKIFETN